VPRAARLRIAEPPIEVGQRVPVEFRQDRDGYEVLIDGRWKMSIPFWLRVPPNRIIDRIDNLTNRAVVCFTPEAGILCFVRPSES